MAERGGFEPPVELLTLKRFSKPPPSATRPSLRLPRIIPEALHSLLREPNSMRVPDRFDPPCDRLPSRGVLQKLFSVYVRHLLASLARDASSPAPALL